MAGRPNQKQKLLQVLRILYEETDDSHGITMAQLLAKLKACGIEAERKSIYEDMEALRTFGVDVIGENSGNAYCYHIGNRPFELVELKLLVDAVQSSRFITEKKSRELIRKLERLASRHEGRELHQQVSLSGGVKALNESIYYNVDRIYEAIQNNVQIQFQYFQWDEKKQMELRHDGQWYHVSPWLLTWSGEKYYLVGYDDREQKCKHYRVDKMLHLTGTQKPRQGKEQFEALDGATYTNKRFSMFDGTLEWVKLRCDKAMAGVLIDRFGKDVVLHSVDQQIEATVEVAVSRPFLGWVLSFGAKIQVVEPSWVVDWIKEELQALQKQYFKE
jgi:predicted DNA-binding transcriptional regulator YafY